MRVLVHRIWPVTRRSAFLMLLGVAYCIIGWSYITGPPAPKLGDQLHLALAVLPLQVFGCIWVACGAAAIVTGIFRWHKPFGFAALTFIASVWGCAYAVGWVAGDAATGYRTAVIFWAIAGAVHIVAGMVDRR